MSTYLRQWFMELRKDFLELRKTRKKDFGETGLCISRFDVCVHHKNTLEMVQYVGDEQ